MVISIGFNLPFFGKKKSWKPSKKELKDSLLKDTKEIRQIPRMLETLVFSAYAAGEKAGREKSNEGTDNVKLIGFVGIGFTLGYIVVMAMLKFGLISA